MKRKLKVVTLGCFEITESLAIALCDTTFCHVLLLWGHIMPISDTSGGAIGVDDEWAQCFGKVDMRCCRCGMG